MKTLYLLSLFLVGLLDTASAQLEGFVFREPPPENPAVKKAREDRERGEYYLASVGTNWVRVVEGKTNRLRFDPGWITIPEFRPFDRNSWGAHSFKVVAVEQDEVIVEDTYRSDYTVGDTTRRFPSVTKYFLLRNWPGADKALTGDSVFDPSVHSDAPQKPMRVMQVGRTNYAGETIPIYDYGIPITNTNPPAAKPARTNAEARR